MNEFLSVATTVAGLGQNQENSVSVKNVIIYNFSF